MPGVNYYDGAQFQEVAALEQSNGQTAPAYRWDGSQWVQIYPAIPDSGLLHHYDATDSATITQDGSNNVTQWDDKEGSENLTGTVSGGLGTINGNQAILFDGTDDRLDVDFGTTVSLGFDIFTVQEGTNDGNDQRVNEAFTNIVAAQYRWDLATAARQLSGPNAGASGGIPSENPEIWSQEWRSSAKTLYVDGTQDASDSSTNEALDGLTVGNIRADSGVERPFDGPIGEVMIYDPSASGYSRSDVESYLSDKWGITV